MIEKIKGLLRKRTDRMYGDVTVCVRTVRDSIDQSMAEDITMRLRRIGVQDDDCNIVGTGLGHILIVVSTDDPMPVLRSIQTACINRSFNFMYAVRIDGVWKTSDVRQMKDIEMLVGRNGKYLEFWYSYDNDTTITIPGHIKVLPDETRKQKCTTPSDDNHIPPTDEVVA